MRALYDDLERSRVAIVRFGGVAWLMSWCAHTSQVRVYLCTRAYKRCVAMIN